MKEDQFITNLIKYGVIGLVALIFVFSSFSTVGPGERGVMITMGKTGTEVLGEGPHFKFPFISSIKTMSVRIHKSQDTSEAATRDMQRVTATVALNWTINPESVGNMLRTVGTEDSIETNIIAPAVSEGQKLLKQTLTRDVLQLEYLKKWNGQLPTVLTGAGGGVMLNIPINSKVEKE